MTKRISIDGRRYTALAVAANKILIKNGSAKIWIVNSKVAIPRILNHGVMVVASDNR